MGIIESMRLDGKAIYVTGGASGIGKCAAMAFAEAGADVAIVDINLEGAQKVADEIKEATGSNTIAIACNVTKQDEVEAMVAKVVETYGKLDACYNNAGICLNVPADEMTLEQAKPQKKCTQQISANLSHIILTRMRSVHSANTLKTVLVFTVRALHLTELSA